MRRAIALMVLVTGCTAFVLLFNTVFRTTLAVEQLQLWRGYYAVLVDDDRSLAEVEQALKNAGFSHTLSRQSAQVQFNSFDELQSVSVAELSSRLDSIDPRFDPYMQRVPALFTAFVEGKRLEVVYVRSDKPPIFVLPQIARTLGAPVSGTLFPAWNPLDALAALLLFLLFAAIVLWRSPRQRSMVAVGALPWLVTAALGGLSSLPVVFALYFVWAYTAELVVPAYRELLRAPRPRWESGPLLRRVSLFAVAVSVAMVLTRVSGESVNVAPAAAATVVLLFVAASFEALRDCHKEHRVFTPLSILQRDMFRRMGGARSKYRSALPWFLALTLFAPFTALVLPEDSVPLVPQPRAVGGVNALSPESLERLWRLESGGDFPTLADYVAHRAFQASYLFGGDYRLPVLGSEVAISRFRRNGNEMSKRRETMMVFDSQWYRSVTDVVGELSPAGLLANGGVPGGVVRERAHRLYWQPLTVLQHFTLVFLVFVPVVFTHSATTVALRRTALNQLARRRRQAA